jgi:hypothetical protein
MAGTGERYFARAGLSTFLTEEGIWGFAQSFRGE